MEILTGLTTSRGRVSTLKRCSRWIILECVNDILAKIFSKVWKIFSNVVADQNSCGHLLEAGHGALPFLLVSQCIAMFPSGNTFLTLFFPQVIDGLASDSTHLKVFLQTHSGNSETATYTVRDPGPPLSNLKTRTSNGLGLE